MLLAIPRNKLVLFQAIHYLQLMTDLFQRIPLKFSLLKQVWLTFVFSEIMEYIVVYCFERFLFLYIPIASHQLL